MFVKSKFSTLASRSAMVLSAVLLGTAPIAHPASALDSQAGEHRVLSYGSDGVPTSGVVSFKMERELSSDLVTVSKLPGLPGTKTEQVGGGTWTYGWELVNFSEKRCFSKYIHRSKSHTATATMGGRSKSSVAKSGNWASAVVIGGVTSGTCNVYWSTQ